MRGQPRPWTWAIWALAALAVGALLGSSVAQAPGQADAPPAGKRVSRLRIAIAGYENNLTPYGITFASGKTIDLVNMIYDTLFYSPFQRRPRPWLARSSSTSPDGRVWTVRMREGLKWQDGMPLTAEDVRFTYRYFAANEQGLYSHHVNDVPDIERVEVASPSTVRFTCRNPCPTFDIDPGALVPILPRHIWKSVAEPAKFTNALPVGSGPYRLVQNVSNQRYVLQANPSYFMGRPLVDRIEMPVIGDSAAMFLALRRGQVDAVTPAVPPASIEALQRSETTVVKMPDYGSVQISFNAQRYPFTLSALRKALNLGVDTVGITSTQIGDRGKPGVESFLDPDSPFADRSLEHRFDPDEARRMLDGLRFRTGSGGIRSLPDGKPFKPELLVNAVEARDVRAAELVSGQLERIGIDVEVTPLDPATLAARRRPPNAMSVKAMETTNTGDYDMFLSTYAGAHYHSDPDGLLYAFHCPGKTGFGAFITGWCNRRFDDLVDRAATLGFDQRKPLLRQAQRVMYDDPPIISLYFPYVAFAYRTEAYSGWRPMLGHGLVHKLSFLPGPRRGAAGIQGSPEGGRPAAPFVIAAAAVLALLATLLVAHRRRRGPSNEQ